MSTQSPGYEELTACLASNDSDFSAAECHAILCGVLSCQNAIDAEDWGRRILSGELEADPNEGPLGTNIHEQDVQMLKGLIADTIQQLDDPEFGFFPLLPEDDDSIEDRSAALGEWSQGYLYGLSLGGLKEFKHLSEQAQEFAQDLVQISSLEIETEESEANEEAFFEIFEYVRMGVLAMRDEISPSEDAPKPPSNDDPTEQKITFH